MALSLQLHNPLSFHQQRSGDGTRCAVIFNTSLDLRCCYSNSSRFPVAIQHKSINNENSYTLKYSVDDVRPLSASVADDPFKQIENPTSGTVESLPETKKKSAKIHDFCFGIPFGGVVATSGLVGYLLSRNSASLTNSVIGIGLLGLSFTSLKIWRQGISSIPFIIGQTVLALVLFVKEYQKYKLTKMVFPTMLYMGISAAMFCFYSYVMISGGNPPPKKLKTKTTNA